MAKKDIKIVIGTNSFIFKWEMFKLKISNFIWRFHPHRNRFCPHCCEMIGNSPQEAARHECVGGKP